MSKSISLTTLLFLPILLFAQLFERSELPTTLAKPWEIIYGPDGYLWLTEANGIVSRVHPETGAYQLVHQAPDYFSGHASEANPECPEIPIGNGTLGMALHPDFLNPTTAFIYYMYSYNAGDETNPSTQFKIKRLLWSHEQKMVVNATDLITSLPNGYDHFGGRMMIANVNGLPYLFVTIGDLGISELNAPHCYVDQANNPNNFTQDVTTMNGKVHRFNLDGTIPEDNPVVGRSWYTRGHRNPQGMMYDAVNERLYSIEHGDHTDDEINVLMKGGNYGWKDVRGYHFDGNHPGETDYINNYQPNTQVQNDQLIPAFYAWCAAPDTLADWCTVAPSDGLYYGSSGIPQWTNSLLVVTLKNGVYGDREVYQFKLDEAGNLKPSNELNPNPKRFFTSDQELNGRLRDIAASPDGQKIYLINNGGTDKNKITVYTYDSTGGLNQPNDPRFRLYPNPTYDYLTIQGMEDPSKVVSMFLTDVSGRKTPISLNIDNLLIVDDLAIGRYILTLETDEGIFHLNFDKISD